MAQTSRVWKNTLTAVAITLMVAACSSTTSSGDDNDATVDEVTSEIQTDDSVDGTGAEAFLAAVTATQDAPLVAEGAPFVISMPNLEGDPAGSFPQAREGAEAAVQVINEQLGGIGADYENGTPGRPVELKVCSHAVTQQSAQACGNKIVGQDPDLVISGIDFFTPLYYPLFEGIPMLQQLPLFPQDFAQPSVYSGVGGCPLDFMAGVKYIVEMKQADKAAFIWVNNATKEGCWTNSEERAAQYYKNQGGFDFRGFPDLAGDPSDDAANIQGVANYLKDAEKPVVYFGIQASDCVNYIKGLRAAGVDAQIVSAAACVDPTVTGLPETQGVDFQFQSYDETMDLSPFAAWELQAREGFINQSQPENPVATFTRDSFSTVMFAWQVANQVVADGGDPTDPATLQAALDAVNNFHFIGRPPLNCADSPAEYASICYRKSTYLQWDGSGFVPEETLNAEFMDVTELMENIEAELPLGS